MRGVCLPHVCPGGARQDHGSQWLHCPLQPTEYSAALLLSGLPACAHLMATGPAPADKRGSQFLHGAGGESQHSDDAPFLPGAHRVRDGDCPRDECLPGNCCCFSWGDEVTRGTSGKQTVKQLARVPWPLARVQEQPREEPGIQLGANLAQLQLLTASRSVCVWRSALEHPSSAFSFACCTNTVPR